MIIPSVLPSLHGGSGGGSAVGFPPPRKKIVTIVKNVSIFADFIRVGALRRVDRQLLGHSIHSTASKNDNNAISELQTMLKTARGREEILEIQKELSEVETL